MRKLIRIRDDIRGDLVESALLGGKAYQQWLAKKDGFPVMDSFVVSTEVFPSREWIHETDKLSCGEKANRTLELLDREGIDLVRELKDLGGNTFAVRSSANVEDSSLASFAGSFCTRLDVRCEEVPRAIFEVWKSGFETRVIEYAKDSGLSEGFKYIKIAVLIQPMIDVHYAGIGFSHPIGQPEDPRIFLNVIKGIGEEIVSGRVKGQTYWLERLSYRIIAYENAIDLGDFYELASYIGMTIERLEILRSYPQDIEFAFDKGLSFVLLQNRPITGRLKL